MRARTWVMAVVLSTAGAWAEAPKPAQARVVNDEVHLSGSGTWAVEAEVVNGALVHLTVVKTITNPDRTLVFTLTEASKTPRRLLQLKNPFSQTLRLEAAIRLPGSATPTPTSMLPVGPGMMSFEAWNDPFTLIVLKHFSLSP